MTLASLAGSKIGALSAPSQRMKVLVKEICKNTFFVACTNLYAKVQSNVKNTASMHDATRLICKRTCATISLIIACKTKEVPQILSQGTCPLSYDVWYYIFTIHMILLHHFLTLCPLDLKETIATLIYAASRCGELAKMNQIKVC